MDFSKHSEGQTSVKVHHKPGGASSFSLAHDTGEDDRWGNTGKVGSGAPKQQQTNFQSTEEKKNDCPDSGPGAFTSVKYSGNPPGGKSSFSLG